jgi:prepilin-type N-terminal cleavage/methylation domain-containing protein
MSVHGLNHNAGFSMVEIAIVLCIIAVIAGGALVMSNAKAEQNKADLTKVRMEAIVDALDRQAQLGGYLLCIAPLNALETAATFGVATDCSDGGCLRSYRDWILT